MTALRSPLVYPSSSNQDALDFLNDMRAYLAGLFGADGTLATALATLGVLIGAGVETRTASATLTAAARGRLILASGTITLTLPAVAAAGAGWSVVVDNTGSGAITLDGAGSETVDGATSAVLPVGRAAIVACTGTAWVTMAMPGTAAGPVLFPPGSAGAPGLAVGGDTDTGLRSPAANQLALLTGGADRVLLTTTALTSTVPFGAPDGTFAAPGIGFAAQPNSGVFRISSTAVGLGVAGAEAARFTSTGRMGMGADPAARIHIAGQTTDEDSRVRLDRASPDGVGPRVQFVKMRGTLGTPAALNSGDRAMTLLASGHDGVGLFAMAEIAAAADAAFAAGSTPGRLIFSTTPSGSTALAERMRIDAAGVKVTGRIEVNGAPIWARQLVIANNAVGVFTPDFTGGKLVMTVGGGVGFTVTDDGACADLHFDVGTTPFIEKQGGWSTRGTLVATSLAVLTGTTEALNFVTVSARPDGTIMVANRLGASKTFRFWGF